MSNVTWFGSKYDYIKIPKKLVLERSSYEGLDSDAIFLYGYLFTKTQQSYGNKQYHDSYGVYVVDNFKQLFNWGKDLTANRLKKLEKLGLIKIRLSSRNHARRVYVQDFNSDAPVTKYFSSQSVYNLQFFSVPTSLFFNIDFLNLSTDAVLLYGVLLDFLSMSKMDIGASYYDSELDAYFLTKDHSYFINLFGWSPRKYARIQKSLTDNSLILVTRVGKTQRNRIYPIDVLSLLLQNKEGITQEDTPKTRNQNDINEVICQNDVSDLPKSDNQNDTNEVICQNDVSDLPKSDNRFAKIRQVICQNPPSDLPKSDTNRLIFNNLSFNNLILSNHINELRFDPIRYLNHFIQARKDFYHYDSKFKKDHTEALYFYMLDNIFANDISDEIIDLFTEYQLNFNDNLRHLESIVDIYRFDDTPFNNAWARYYDEAKRLLSKTKDILFKIYKKDPSITILLKKYNTDELTTLKNILKMNPDRIIEAISRVHNYFDFTNNTINNYDAFIIKTLIKDSSEIITVDDYYDYSNNLAFLLEKPKKD